MPIEHVSDTARWVAFYRAMETERPDALFRDPFARRLAGEQGERIVDEIPRGRATAWAMITRTAVFDEIILDTIARRNVDTVLNLAAGLDARPWRLPLPPTLRWIDVDLPAMLNHKASVIGDAKPACRYEAIAADLVDPVQRAAVFSRIGSESSSVLVVTEGLLIYLTPEQVGGLAAELHTQRSFRWWLIDLASPRLLQMLARSWGRHLTRANAPFRFGPANGTEFFRQYGWREAEFRSAMVEARRLDRQIPMAWLWWFLGRFSSEKRKEEFRRMSAFVLLERADD